MLSHASMIHAHPSHIRWRHARLGRGSPIARPRTPLSTGNSTGAHHPQPQACTPTSASLTSRRLLTAALLGLFRGLVQDRPRLLLERLTIDDLLLEVLLELLLGWR